MPAKILAIANCRVSSDEQLQSNSLNRQQLSAEAFAKKLGAELLRTWSGSVSSKAGTNISRKDLEEMLDVCKKNKQIKYAIFDELDRFMRSMLEIGYFLVEFKRLGVKVVFASQPDLNTNTAADTLMLMLEAYKAEGSNEERQRKSIRGQTAALKDGRWPFVPKPGYMRGVLPGMPLIHPERGPALQRVLKRLAAGLLTPSAALAELNNSEFSNAHSVYKMDEKFIKIVTDPFYAGILVMDRQVKVINENGLHDKLITEEEHLKLVDIMFRKPKYQTGPRKNGNPEFPMSNLLIDDQCTHKKNGGKAVGLDLNNGKNTSKIYKKYRCRSCNRYWSKDPVHEQVENLFEKYEMNADVRKDVLAALEVVWKQNEVKVVEDTARLKQSAQNLRLSISQQVESATDPSNAQIKQEIIALIESKRVQLKKLEIELSRLNDSRENDHVEFMEFALDFVEDTGKHFLKEYVSRENRLRCKQLKFPAGIMINQKDKVYTPEISVFYRVATKKKSAEALENSLMVRAMGL